MNNNQMNKEEKEKFISLQNEKMLKFVKSNNLRKVEASIKNGADISYMQNLALEYSLIEKNKEIAQLLINYGISLSAFDNQIVKKMLKAHQFEMIDFLVEKGVDLNGEDNILTPLIYCIEKNNIKGVEYLLKNNVNVTIKNNQALSKALEYGNFHIIKLLIEGGAKLNEEGEGPLTTAIHINEVLKNKDKIENKNDPIYGLRILSQYGLRYESIKQKCYDLHGNEIDVLNYLLSHFTIDLNKLENNKKINEEVKRKLISDLFHNKLQNELGSKETMRKNKL